MKSNCTGRFLSDHHSATETQQRFSGFLFRLRDMEIMSFVILSLATWRISSLFVNEPGPWDIFKRVRELTGIQHNEQGEIFLVPERFLPKLFSCVWCFSVWVAFGLATLFFLFPDETVWVTLPFALSAVAIIMQRRAT